MDNGRQFVHKQDAELRLDFSLQKVTHKRDRIERRGNLERLERIVPEDHGDAFLLRKDQYNKTGKFEFGQSDLERNGEGRPAHFQPQPVSEGHTEMRAMRPVPPG